jgi:multisubunit Na+/H+ antiporter MnhG subunit
LAAADENFLQASRLISAGASFFGSLAGVKFRNLFRRAHESKNHHHTEKSRP